MNEFQTLYPKPDKTAQILTQLIFEMIDGRRHHQVQFGSFWHQLLKGYVHKYAIGCGGLGNPCT